MPAVPGPTMLLEAWGLRKHFGPVKALDDVDMAIRTGEVLGLAGHNGAGKSTLMNVLATNLRADAGRLRIGAETLHAGTFAARARRLGIRMVFQELSLCDNLTIAENFIVRHRPTRRLWRGEARRRVLAALAEVFPRQDFDPDRRVADLPIDQRQMVEIACAAAPSTEAPARLLILDEPTSSLDAQGVDQLLAWLRQMHRRDLAVIFITHRLNELVASADRIMVMRDGRVVADEPNRDLTAAHLVERMGSVGAAPVRTVTPRRDASGARAALIDVDGFTEGRLAGIKARMAEGEIVGLGGLAEHGQRELLHAIYSASFKPGMRGACITVRARAAFVSGDRGREGIFPQWSTGLNIAIGSLRQLARRIWLDRRAERRTGIDGLRELDIRAPSAETPITALSGGSQQKSIMARALGSGARIILFDDPTRGVDVTTKRDIYARLRRDVAQGRTFVLYSTETAELLQCDRVLVLRAGRVVAELEGEDLTEAALVRASFADAA